MLHRSYHTYIKKEIVYDIKKMLQSEKYKTKCKKIIKQNKMLKQRLKTRYGAMEVRENPESLYAFELSAIRSWDGAGNLRLHII